MNFPRLHGIVPPLPTPLKPDESIDTGALSRLVDAQIQAGVHGLWVLGTTARFDLLTDDRMREVAEVVAETAAGRVPLVLNVSDQGTQRTQRRARFFDDLPYDYYAALPPWYLPMTVGEVSNYFVSLAETLSRPIVIYNAPWVCNQLSFPTLRKLAEHPRIVGCKDVTPSLSRAIEFSREERRALDFSYLHGSDQIALSTELGADGFVSALSNAIPELAVAIWNAIQSGDGDSALRFQAQMLRIARTTEFGTMHACLEVIMEYRGFLESMLPAPLRSLEAEAAKRVVDVAKKVGMLPRGVPVVANES